MIKYMNLAPEIFLSFFTIVAMMGWISSTQSLD